MTETTGTVEKPGVARTPWSWVPSLYFAEGLPYVVVMTVSVIMYKRFGISNTDIALYTSWLYLPWVIKPIWSPFVEMFGTRRTWILAMQLLIGAGFACVALTIPTAAFFRYSLAVLWLMAFSSATHDIAADGFYMLGLDRNKQAAFVGVRSMFYRGAMIAGQGLLVVLAGMIEHKAGGSLTLAWATTFGVLAVLFAIMFLLHTFVLPRPVPDMSGKARSTGEVLMEFWNVLVTFFNRRGIGTTLAFLLLYRFAESQLVKLATPFLLDPREKGGLGLSTEEVGIVYGTIGVVALTLGGLLGGFFASKKGLKAVLWPMVLAIHLPDAVFIYLSHYQPDNFLIINCAVAFEQFGYGFGFTAYLLYMMMIAEGEHKTAHYALCTGFMALGMMLPGLFSGALQEYLGYKNFFNWVMLSTIPGFVVAALIKIDPLYGRKETA
jgi:MFS transporter, PAT family, beta-lactamase induction signal transducer AmpG